MEFVPFPKIPRLSRECVITEKIDGTNACIHIGIHGEFFTGSRRKWITPEDDNYGFSKWAHEHKDELIAGLGIGTHYGEWWGCGIQRNYGLKEKHFSLFNTGRWSKLDSSNPLGNGNCPPCCDVVPVIYEGVFDTNVIDGILEQLKSEGSYAAPGFKNPEGIVIFHKASGALFKKTIEKDNERKGK